MGLRAFKQYQELLKKGYVPKRIGFNSKVAAGDINRFSSRMRLVRSFEGINLDVAGASMIDLWDGERPIRVRAKGL